MDKIKRLKEIINDSKTLVVITGAGISVPSGIPDFRSGNNDIDFEHILTYGYMMDNPKEFYSYYSKYLYHPNARPNTAHYYLAKLERSGKLNSIITQNIDGLHDMAGSKRVFPIHGYANQFYCASCEKKFEMNEKLIRVPNYCKCGGLIRPNITLYTEPMDETYYHLASVAVQIADTLIVIGSSLTVSSVTNLLNYYAGSRLVIINKTPTRYDRYAELIINEDIVDVISKLEEL